MVMNSNNDKKALVLTILVGLTMLLMTVGSAFAYYAVVSTTENSTTATITGRTQRIGVVSLTNEITNLKIATTSNDMSKVNQRNYYSTLTTNADGYDNEANLREIALLSVNGGENDTVYKCTLILV